MTDNSRRKIGVQFISIHPSNKKGAVKYWRCLIMYTIEINRKKMAMKKKKKEKKRYLF